MNYIALMQIAYYDIMCACESGDCADFHFNNCFSADGFCFYDNLLQSSYTALELGWA